MPFLRSVTVAAMLAAAPTSAFAQMQQGITLGVVGGYNLTTFGGRDAGPLAFKAKSGRAGGVVVLKGLSRHVFVRSGFTYSQHGSERTDTLDPTKGVRIQLNYLQVPLLVGYTFYPTRRISPFALAGLMNGLKMSCTYVSWTSTKQLVRDCAAATVQFSAKKNDVAGTLGGGVSLIFGRGNSLTVDATWSESQSIVGADPKALRLRNRGLAVRFGLLFPERRS